MAGMTDLAIRIATTLDSTGLNKADKSVGKLSKSVKSLGRTLGITLGAAAFAAYGKAAVKAFSEDEKAVVKLNNSLKNLGLELAAPSVNQYIDTLSRATAVADDQLRPAFQALINTTGSLTASQKLLADSIDISAGSGVALETVAQDLASAYVGKTRALGKYNLGLSQAQLKTASFESLMLRLNKQFSGANAAYLDTYAGKMQALGVAGGEAQEKIGGAIVDLATALSGASDVEGLINKIDSLTDKIVGMFDAFQEGVAILRGVLNAKTFGGMRDAIQKAQVEENNRRMRRDYMKAWEGTDLPKSAKQLAAEKAAEAEARKRAKMLTESTKKNTAELKKQAALKKAGTIFDLEQIQLIAALKGKLSDEDRKRVELQFALLMGNTSEAKKLTYELAIAQGLTVGIAKDLASLPDAKNPFASWADYLDMLMSKARQVASVGSNISIGTGQGGSVIDNYKASIPQSNVTPLATSEIKRLAAPMSSGSSTIGDYLNVTLQIDGKTIASALQDTSLSGIPSSVNRTYGSFAGR